MAKRKGTKGQTKTLQNTTQQLQIEQHEPHWKPRVDPGAPERLRVWHSSWNSDHKEGGISHEYDYDYNKRNISVVICGDTHIP